MVPIIIESNFRPTEALAQARDAIRAYGRTHGELGHLANTAYLDARAWPETKDYGHTEITEENWAQLVDPAQPTIGIHFLESLTDAPLLAIASQRLRERGEPSCNIILLHHPLYGNELMDKTNYYVKCGVLLDAHGGIYMGDFPEKIRLDAINGEGASEHTRKRIPAYINTPEQQKLLHDKHAVHKRLGGTAIQAPLLGVWNPHDPRSGLLISKLLAKHPGIVTKPAQGSLGSGVLIHRSDQTNASDIAQASRTAYGPDESIIIERLEESLPLYHPRTGTRLDWNIRLLVAGGEVAGGYARVGRLGGSINKGLGAQQWVLPDALQACGLSLAGINEVTERLRHFGRDIYKYIDADQMGVDAIIRPDLTPVAAEINDERSGGIKTLTRLHGDLSVAEAVVRNWRTSPIFKTFPRPLQPDAEHAVPIDNATILGELITLSYQDADLREMADMTCIDLLTANSVPKGLRTQALRYFTNQPEKPATPSGRRPITRHLLQSLGHEARYSPLVLSFFRQRAQKLFSQPASVADHKDIARAFLPERLTRKTVGLLASHHEAPETAIIYGKAIWWQVLKNTGVDPHGFPLKCCTALENAISSHLLDPGPERDRLRPNIDAAFSTLAADEQAYIKPAADTLHLLALLAQQDYQQLAANLPSAEEAQTPAYQPVLKLINDQLIRQTDPAAMRVIQLLARTKP